MGHLRVPIVPTPGRSRLAAGLDRIFGDLDLGRAAWDTGPATGPALEREPESTIAWDPDVEVFRRGEMMVIRADLPGFTKEQVHVDVAADVLTISGEWPAQQPADPRDHHRSERNHQTFYRAISLMEGTDADRCQASFEHGVLEVEILLPTAPGPRRTQIPIR